MSYNTTFSLLSITIELLTPTRIVAAHDRVLKFRWEKDHDKGTESFECSVLLHPGSHSDEVRNELLKFSGNVGPNSMDVVIDNIHQLATDIVSIMGDGIHYLYPENFSTLKQKWKKTQVKHNFMSLRVFDMSREDLHDIIDECYADHIMSS